MVLLFDIDGVIRDWANSARRVLDTVGYDLRPIDECKWGFETWFYDPIPKEEIEDLVYDKLAEEVYLSAGEILHAREALYVLSAIGHEIWLVSNQFTPKLRTLTDAWLENHDIQFTGKIYTANKHLVHGDFFLDDKPENVMNMLHSVDHAYLFDQPWNQETNLRKKWRVMRWEEVKYLIEFIDLQRIL
jgi:5'(3')-deoxyribonucleotidase